MKERPNDPRAREVFNEKANEWLRAKIENLSVLARYPKIADSLGLTKDQLLSAKNYLPGEIKLVFRELRQQAEIHMVEVSKETASSIEGLISQLKNL